MGKDKNAQAECRKRLRESGSQTDEDSLQEEASGGHCCDAKFDDDDYVEAISKMIPVWVEKGRRELSNHGCVWDWLKYNIRIFSVKHSKNKSKTLKEREINLQNKYNKAKQKIEND